MLTRVWASRGLPVERDDPKPSPVMRSELYHPNWLFEIINTTNRIDPVVHVKNVKFVWLICTVNTSQDSGTGQYVPLGFWNGGKSLHFETFININIIFEIKRKDNNIIYLDTGMVYENVFVSNCNLMLMIVILIVFILFIRIDTYVYLLQFILIIYNTYLRDVDSDYLNNLLSL